MRPWLKYLGNPILSPREGEYNTSFTSVVEYEGVYHAFYYYHLHPSWQFRVIGHATSMDGLKWIRDYENNPILGSGLGWDSRGVSVPMVWREGSKWYMLYRGQAPYRVGLAISSKPEGPWDRRLKPVIHEAEEGWGIIKVDGAYYLYTNNTGGERKIYLWASENLTDWRRVSEEPLWSGGRFCAFVFKRDQLYYALVPHYTIGYGYSEIELYSCPNQIFSPQKRHYLGIAIAHGGEGSWDDHNLDTPFVLTDTIERSSFTASRDKLWCYYGGQQAGIWRTGVTIEDNIDEVLKS